MTPPFGSYFNNLLTQGTVPPWQSYASGIQNTQNIWGSSFAAPQVTSPIFNNANNYGNVDNFTSAYNTSGGFSDALMQAIQQIGGLPQALSVPSPIDPNTEAGKDAKSNIEALNSLGYYALVTQNPQLWDLYIKSIQGTNLEAEKIKAKQSNISGYDAEKGMLLKQAGEERLKEKGSTKGYCARGVNDVLQSVGIKISRGDAYQQADKLENNKNFKKIEGLKSSDLKNLPAGAIVVWRKTEKSPYGHISIATGDGKEISDHKQKQITSLRGDTQFQVFIPV
ncbi:MAG: hypothetical protein PHE78_08635 [Candidatus Gastranaerophilales bacterium]|nr:hypothetical protein [Candidatus Gastranaerophilales bacterium]